MAEKHSTLSDSKIHWKEGRSINGKVYRIGSEISGIAAADEKSFSIDVLWPWVKSIEDEWADTNDETRKKTSITRWKLHELPAITPWYQWCLEFTCTKKGVYRFTDKAPGKDQDTYEVNVIVPGDHTVWYRSENPAITRVSGNFKD